MEHKNFKPFEKVLVKDTGEWTCTFYSHWSEKSNVHFTTTLVWYRDARILPYEGNEHLLGTCDEPEKEEALIEVGELCYGFYNMDDLYDFDDIVFGRFDGISKVSEEILVSNAPVDICIPYSKFDPNDIEATKKEAITVNPHTHKLVKVK